MQDIIQFDHFIFKVQWLVLAISCLLGYFVIRLQLNKFKKIKRSINDTLINVVIIIILVWRFSLIFFNPVKVFSNPLALIYFSGGTDGFFLSIIIAAVYLIYSSSKQGISVFVYANFIASGFLTGAAVYNITNLIVSRQFPVFYAGQSILMVSLLLWQIKKSSHIDSVYDLNQLILWFSLGQVFISHFKGVQVNTENNIWNFSLQKIIFYALSIITICLNFILESKILNNSKS